MSDAILLKVERANKHIAELSAVIKAFKRTNPYQLVGKRDPQSGERVAYLHKLSPIPNDVPIIAGDVIQNLYCALDYLAAELVLAGGGKVTSKTAFPITRSIPTTKDEKARYEGQVCGMSKEVKELLLGLRPHRGANNSFWRLHKLNNINKHRSLVTMMVQPSGFGCWGDLADKVTLARGPLHKGGEVARFPSDAENYQDVQFTMDIALNEPEADASHFPLILALRVCYNTVLATVGRFAAYRP